MKFFICEETINFTSQDYYGVNLRAIEAFRFTPGKRPSITLYFQSDSVGIAGKDAIKLLEAMGLEHPVVSQAEAILDCPLGPGDMFCTDRMQCDSLKDCADHAGAIDEGLISLDDDDLDIL